ncbi:short-chain dehydrogenase [Lojkania enalia]|uniref:Short-chain dehydrogenase n=1 Tax=Lojkania enalia TaxID=147567 RepID=A0A9P4NDA8_9PLEO|nr:short-chain dehydrogenase [Didymosphaeria enalia]
MSPYNLPPDAVWFITGCSSGIGQALCTYLLTSTQCRVVATARDPKTLSRLPESPNLLKLPLDVTCDSAIEAALTSTRHHWARIDVVVNNAGHGLMTDTETADLDAAYRLLDTNFWSAVRITQRTLPILRDENGKTGPRGGVVVQMSSLGGRLAFAGNAFYHASKFALEGFTEAISKEVAEEWGVHFVLVEPGGVRTGYADTSTSSMIAGDGTRHPAYRDPRLATNRMLEYKRSAEGTKNWAEAEMVAAAIYRVVSEGVGDQGEIPLRVPLGSDSWGMLKGATETTLEELERVKGVSLSTSGEVQMKSVEFLMERA